MKSIIMTVVYLYSDGGELSVSSSMCVSMYMTSGRRGRTGNIKVVKKTKLKI